MSYQQFYKLKGLYTLLIIFTGLLLSNFSAKAQCYEDFYVYQVYPYGQLCSPQYATLRAEYYSNGSYFSGEFRWYSSDTDPLPVQTNYIHYDYGTYTADYTVYANDGTTVWVSFYNYNTGCESYRTPYTFTISPSPYVYQDYARKCGYDIAKVQLSSNVSGVTFQLYKFYEYYDPNWGWTQEYQLVQSNSTGYFEIFDFDPATDVDKYYAKVYQPYSCSQSYYNQLWFDITSQDPPTVSGNLSVSYGLSTTLTASGTAYNFRWYDAGNNLLTEGWQYTTPSTLIAGSYTYYVRGVSMDGSCLSDPMSVTVTVTGSVPVITYTSLYNSSNFTRTIDLSKPVGAIAGTEGITSSGGTTYSIPIYSPPGTNNIKSNVTIAYNSQAGSGIAGLGWNISGLSVITRTGKNIYHNGLVKPVNYTAEDAFMLDGVHLNPVSGNNGDNGTVYAGEVETYSKIISNTTNSPNNPDWFQVIAKDGSIMEFGRTADSRILTENGVNVMLWRLNRILDVNGNYIDFVYDNSDRDSRIATIKYTGNINTGLVPDNSLTFNYKIRNDRNTGYDAGGSLSSYYLLDKVTVSAENNTARQYQLNYGFDNVTSLLKEVIESGSDGTALNSTIFLYGDQPQDMVTNSITLPSASYDFIAGDFDADGKTDLMTATVNTSVSLNSYVKYHTDYQIRNSIIDNPSAILYSSNLSSGTTVTSKNKSQYNFLTADYNGDGRDDVLLTNSSVENSSADYPLRLNNISINNTASNNTYTTTTNYFPLSNNNFGYQYNKKGNFLIPGDFDGDSNQDYILLVSTYPTYSDSKYNYNYKAFFTNPVKNIINQEIQYFGIPPVAGVRNFPPGTIVTTATAAAEADITIPADFDGDGKSEILMVKGQEGYIIDVSETPPSTGYLYNSSLKQILTSINKDCKIFPGDFNGDRKTDLLVRNSDGTWKIMYSTGITFTSTPFTFNQSVYFNNNGYNIDHILQTGDFNGDGKSDILHGFTENGQSKFSLYYTRGNSSTSPFYYEQYLYNNYLASGQNGSAQGFVLGDFNGDGRTDVINRKYSNTPGDFISFKPFGKERLLSKVTDGYNNTTSFEYKNLTENNASIYDRTISLDDPANQYPFNYVKLPITAVSSVSSPNGIGGSNTTTFKYENALVHRAGKGFLGFKKIRTQNSASGITSVTENDINALFAVPYTVKQSNYLTATNELLFESQITTSFTDLSTSSGKRFFQKTDKVLGIDYLNGTASETANTYDSYGNVTTNVSKVGTLSGSTVHAVETSTTSTAYSIHNTPVPALPDNVTVSNVRSGMPAKNATTQFTYTANGLVSSKTEFAGLAKAVTTSYIYNSAGNPITVTTSAAGLNNRIANFSYDSKNRFAITKQITGTNISQSESYSYDNKWGKPLSQTSSDCLTTTFEYDGFGMLKKTNLPEGYSINHSLNWDVQGGNLFYSFTDYPGGNPDVKTWVDILGRETKKQVAGFNNQWLTQLSTYDAKGNVITKTNPYSPSETSIVTTNSYDTYNRLYSISNSLNTIISTYTPLSGGRMQVVTQDATGQSSTKISDASGKIITAIDTGGQLDYTYDSRGSQTQVTHGSTVIITTAFDDYGRQTTLVDKNAGTTTYDYDALGQLKQQTDNNGNTYNMSYDDFGRITSRQGPEGTTTYEYYKDGATGCSNNTLSKVTGFNNFIKEYTFDNLKRPQIEKVRIDNTDYITQYEYDIYSNLTKTTYPSGVVVNNTYDVNGELLTVTGGNASSPTTLFTGTQMNGFGHYTSYTLGNSRTTQNTYTNGMPTRFYTQGIQDMNMSFNYANGNVLSRNDAIKNITETFQYDALNRLTQSSVNGTMQLNLNFDGNGNFSMGNIVSKTDAGNYVYKNDKIHAVAYITNPASATAQPVTIATTEQSISYTPFLKTSSISEGAYKIDYTYGADYQRVKSILQQNNAAIETRIYAGNYEKQVTGSTTREIHYVSGGNGLCAMIVRENAVNNFYFVYTDHLGSILTITDVNANVVTEQNFDAWGRNRNPNTWQYSNVPAVSTWLYRGYTGHEHVPQFTLINMNGRMYDPIQGRMLSPDNYVPDPLHTQGYNRYSYAMNNPLKYTDPDGNNPLLMFTLLFGAGVSGTQAELQGKSFLGGFAKGLALGLVSNGIGSIFGPTGTILREMGRGLAHGTVNGLISSVSGSTFGSGFLAGAFGSISGSAIDAYIKNPWISLGVSSLSGGLGSRLGGGNFWEGFVTAGISTATNQLLHTINERIAETAEKYIGSKDWNYEVEKDNFDKNTNKCNQFVYDVTSEAGASPGKPNGNFLKRWLGFGSPPVAGQWADPEYKIPGWRVVSNPRRGDVVAYKFDYSDATGHTAIVVGRGMSVGTSGTYKKISRTAFGFSNNPNFIPNGAKYVYRRYTGR